MIEIIPAGSVIVTKNKQEFYDVYKDYSCSFKQKGYSRIAVINDKGEKTTVPIGKIESVVFNGFYTPIYIEKSKETLIDGNRTNSNESVIASTKSRISLPGIALGNYQEQQKLLQMTFHDLESKDNLHLISINSYLFRCAKGFQKLGELSNRLSAYKTYFLQNILNRMKQTYLSFLDIEYDFIDILDFLLIKIYKSQYNYELALFHDLVNNRFYLREIIETISSNSGYTTIIRYSLVVNEQDADIIVTKRTKKYKNIYRKPYFDIIYINKKGESNVHVYNILKEENDD